MEQGLEAALNRKKRDRPSKLAKIDGDAEAHLVALGCSSPPEGHPRWTLRLLADKAVELRIVDVRKSRDGATDTKKTRLSLI